MVFTLAHLSDPHLNPMPRIRPVDLMGKRAIGYANWVRSRRRLHDMVLLGRVLDDIAAQQPDHIACTGDVTHIGLAAEFPTATAFLGRLGPRDRVSFVPGNHDAYVPASLHALDDHMRPWSTSDDGATGYPWLKRRGPLALIGLTSAVPTGPLMAWGRLGTDQLEKAERLLHDAGRQGLTRMIMIHHPPQIGGAKPGRELKDAAAFQTMLARTGAELVVHGHNHRTSLAWLDGPSIMIPVVGVASCSMGPRGHGEHAGWHLFRFGDGPITLERRGLTPTGGIGLLDQRALEAP
ncbi:MAG: metallophosphoesterase [Hyphomicrobiales bacterium]|nr:metallophosphoesterase [Hyphomicrobiales bacterium]